MRTLWEHQHHTLHNHGVFVPPSWTGGQENKAGSPLYSARYMSALDVSDASRWMYQAAVGFDQRSPSSEIELHAWGGISQLSTLVSGVPLHGCFPLCMGA